jgi:hypothetical protein
MQTTKHSPNEITGHCSCLACQTVEQSAIEAQARRCAAASELATARWDARFGRAYAAATRAHRLAVTPR